MCGIFGFISTNKIPSTKILDGLKTLEYRGYDSWGVATQNGTIIKTEKNIGKIGLATTSLKATNIGIGHTRWATHGGVTIANAHPHLDCESQIAVVHNGIIENYSSLKSNLLKKGHKFISQTDTEVIAHLIEEHLKVKDFMPAVKDSFSELSGLNAIVVMSAVSQEIIAIKNGSPLIVGVEKDGYSIASDLAALLPSTKKVVFLNDHEMAILGRDLNVLTLPDIRKAPVKIETINWNIEVNTKGNFEHFMLKEINEQPKVITNIVNGTTDQIKALATLIKKARGTYFIAAGTAFNAALGGAYLFSRVSKRHVNTALASEFNYLLDFLTPESLVIALSQSGETIDIIEPITTAKRNGVKIAGIINTLGSTLYRMADFKLLLGAGQEKAVASTKAYIAKLVVLTLVSYQLAGRVSTIKSLLLKASREIEEMTKESFTSSMRELASKLSKKNHIYTLGRGPSYPTALEAALKIKEVSYIPTEGLAGGELKHGTIALIERGVPVIVFAPNDETYEAIISNATEIKARGGEIIGISFKPNAIFDEYIHVKDIGDATLITQIVPVQILAYYLAVKLGNDPDKPRNLAKSVTVK